MSSVRPVRQSDGFSGLTPNSRTRNKEVDQVLSNVMKEVRVTRESLEHANIFQLPNVELSVNMHRSTGKFVCLDKAASA